MDNAVTIAPPRWQDRLGRGLMWFASAGALVAFTFGISAVRAATPDTVWVEAWRMFGFLVFSGLFAVLALRPRLSAGVWELVFFHKAAMLVFALFLAEAKDAALASIADTILVVLMLAAYCCTRGWRSWRLRDQQAPRPLP